MFEEVMSRFEKKISSAIIDMDYGKALTWIDATTEFIIISFEFDTITFDESLKLMNKFSGLVRKINNIKESEV